MGLFGYFGPFLDLLGIPNYINLWVTIFQLKSGIGGDPPIETMSLCFHFFCGSLINSIFIFDPYEVVRKCYVWVNIILSWNIGKFSSNVFVDFVRKPLYFRHGEATVQEKKLKARLRYCQSFGKWSNFHTKDETLFYIFFYIFTKKLYVWAKNPNAA